MSEVAADNAPAPQVPQQTRERKDAGEAIGRVLAWPPLGRQRRPAFKRDAASAAAGRTWERQ